MVAAAALIGEIAVASLTVASVASAAVAAAAFVVAASSSFVHVSAAAAGAVTAAVAVGDCGHGCYYVHYPGHRQGLCRCRCFVFRCSRLRGGQSGAARPLPCLMLPSLTLSQPCNGPRPYRSPRQRCNDCRRRCRCRCCCPRRCGAFRAAAVEAVVAADGRATALAWLCSAAGAALCAPVTVAAAEALGAAPGVTPVVLKTAGEVASAPGAAMGAVAAVRRIGVAAVLGRIGVAVTGSGRATGWDAATEAMPAAIGCVAAKRYVCVAGAEALDAAVGVVAAVGRIAACPPRTRRAPPLASSPLWVGSPHARHRAACCRPARHQGAVRRRRHRRRGGEDQGRLAVVALGPVVGIVAVLRRAAGVPAVLTLGAAVDVAVVVGCAAGVHAVVAFGDAVGVSSAKGADRY